MARRMPRPPRPRPVRCELSEAELRAVEDAAHLCRLSVAGFVRVVLIESAAHPERLPAWLEIAARLSAPPEGNPRPGRPRRRKKGPD
jgi:hypothetical protein